MEINECSCENRYPESPIIPGRSVVPNLESVIAINRYECTYCRVNINAYLNAFKEHFIINPCSHVLHPICAIKAMLRYGLTPEGDVYCYQCSM